MAPRDSVELHYTKEEAHPVRIQDSARLWMTGFVVIRSNPYMSKTDINGQFRIEKIPKGDHVFLVWHEEYGFLKPTENAYLVDEKPARWKLTIGPSGIDLGTIHIEQTRPTAKATQK